MADASEKQQNTTRSSRAGRLQSPPTVPPAMRARDRWKAIKPVEIAGEQSS